MKKSLVLILALCVAAALLLSACGQAKKEVESVAESVVADVKDAVADATDKAAEVVEEVKDAAAEAVEGAKDAVEGAKDAVADAVEGAKDAVADTVEEVVEDAKDASEKVLDAAEDVAEQAADTVEDAKDAAADVVEEVKDEAADDADKAADAVDEIKEEVADAVGEVKDEAADAADKAADAVDEVKEEVADVVDEVKDEAADAAEGSEEPVAVMSYEEYAAAALDEEVAVEVYVQNHQSWWDGKISVYAADNLGGYFIYNMACSEEDAEKLVPGTKIHVTGYKAEWSGEVEISDATFEFVEDDSEPYIAEAQDVTDILGSDELIDHMNQYVSFTGLTIEPSTDADGNEAAFLYNWDGSGTQGDDLYFNVSINDETFTFTVESYLCGQDTDVYKAVEALNVGDVVDMEGFLYWYNGANPHITSVTVK